MKLRDPVEADLVMSLATDDRPSTTLPGAWLDVEQQAVYPNVHVGSFVRRLEKAHADVKSMGACRCQPEDKVMLGPFEY